MRSHLLLALVATCALPLVRAEAGAEVADSVGLQFLFSVSSSAPNASFSNPQGLGFDADRSEIYVADTGNDQIVVLSRSGVPVFRFRHWVRDHQGERIQGEPHAVLPCGGGMLLITDGLSDQVDQVDLQGRPVRAINVTQLLGRPGRASPGRMARDDDGNLYLVDTGTNSVLVLDPQGQLLRRIGKHGKGEGQFEMIADVAVGVDRTVFMLDSVGTPVVQSFDGKGRWLSGFGRHSDKPQDFHFPAALTMDADGRLWVADAFSHEVKAYSASGQFLAGFGGMGTGPGQFFFPSDLVASPDGVLYVLEKAGRRLQAFQIVRSVAPREEVKPLPTP